jgi:hypothetical protein
MQYKPAISGSFLIARARAASLGTMLRLLHCHKSASATVQYCNKSMK